MAKKKTKTRKKAPRPAKGDGGSMSVNILMSDRMIGVLDQLCESLGCQTRSEVVRTIIRDYSLQKGIRELAGE